jgi:hypothetical protein
MDLLTVPLGKQNPINDLRRGQYEVLAVDLPNAEGHCILTIRHLGNKLHEAGKIYHVNSWWFPNGVLRTKEQMIPQLSK